MHMKVGAVRSFRVQASTWVSARETRLTMHRQSGSASGRACCRSNSTDAWDGPLQLAWWPAQVEASGTLQAPGAIGSRGEVAECTVKQF